jgi:ABC-2 type transport system ATP-binding protein
MTAGRIVVSGLTKTFGPVRAVDDLSFVVEPGTVTGFLGPNGAGKTTTLRMLVGLVTPDAGTATIGGQRYVDLPAPSDTVGAALDTTGFHPARAGRDHLRVYCTVNGYPLSRADEVLELVGLADAAARPVKGYSLGMRQRLALATALLGNPRVLVLDEPVNGLDPEGIVWIRRLLRDLADQGRTVLVSSHLLWEVQQLVDQVVIINRGRLVRQGDLADLSRGFDSLEQAYFALTGAMRDADPPARSSGRACGDTQLAPATDQAGIAEYRRRALAGLREQVIEFGAGDGVSTVSFPAMASAEIAVEPSATQKYHRYRPILRAADTLARMHVLESTLIVDDLAIVRCQTLGDVARLQGDP